MWPVIKAECDCKIGSGCLTLHASYPERLDKLIGRVVPLIACLRDLMGKGLTAQMAEYERYIQEVQALRADFDPLQTPSRFQRLHRSFGRLLAGHERLARHISGMLKTTDAAYVQALAAEFPRVEEFGERFSEELWRINQKPGR